MEFGGRKIAIFFSPFGYSEEKIWRKICMLDKKNVSKLVDLEKFPSGVQIRSYISTFYLKAGYTITLFKF